MSGIQTSFQAGWQLETRLNNSCLGFLILSEDTIDDRHQCLFCMFMLCHRLNLLAILTGVTSLRLLFGWKRSLARNSF